MRRQTAMRLVILATLAVAGNLRADADEADATAAMATSYLEFGASTAKLLWIATNPPPQRTSQAESKSYQALALKVKHQIELGRASSNVVAANFYAIGATLGAAAYVDPDLLSKAAVTIAALGSKKAGDYLAQAVLDKAMEQARGVLAAGLQQSGISSDQIDRMTPEQLKARVADLKIGGKAISDILKDDPESLRLLQEQSVDMATNIGIRAIYVSDATKKSVEGIRAELFRSRSQLQEYQESTSRKLDKVTAELELINEAVDASRNRLEELSTVVAGNTRAVSVLAQVSYSGWTTSQKLQAVNEGLFPELEEGQRLALIATLQADRDREVLVSRLQSTVNDLSSLATIASNIGIPADVVTGIQGAQLVATGVAKFATGDYLGAVASVTSLVGLGSPDAGAERHAATMKYLAEQFAQVNAKLDKIVDLQIKTIDAILQLAIQQQNFRADVLSRLDRLESEVLSNNQILQAVMLSEWKECYALINGPILNGRYVIESRDELLKILSDRNAERYVDKCYSEMLAFLDAWVRPGAWSGQVIAAGNFPSEVIQDDKASLRSLNAYTEQQMIALSTARDFLIAVLPEARQNPVPYIVRILQPVANVVEQKRLQEILGAENAVGEFKQYTCDRGDVVSSGVKGLICFGARTSGQHKPLSDRFHSLLFAGLIGPHAMRIVDTGVAVSTLADLGIRASDGSFRFVHLDPDSGDGANRMISEGRLATSQGKGRELLLKLQWLSEAMILQQSVMYGDYVAELIEGVLYDPLTRALTPTVPAERDSRASLITYALAAMRSNPVLARNVVLLGMRHALADAEGGYVGAEKFRFHQTQYAFARRDFAGIEACRDDPIARRKLDVLFPNWRFELRATRAERENNTDYAACMPATEPDASINNRLPAGGSGLAVSLGDFYVLAPSPVELSRGLFSQPNSLRFSLQYRDQIAQALAERDIASYIGQVSEPGVNRDRISLEVINKALR